MKNMRPAKRVLSLLLVLAMMVLIPAGPLSAYAEMGTEAAPAQEAAEEATATEGAESTATGEEAATAESAEEAVDGEDASSEEEEEQPEMTEGGHIDGEKLKVWLENYLAADHWDEPQCSISVCFWYSGSDETWMYNPDEWMYGVNWSKLPICMNFAEKLGKGELSNDTSINGITLEYALQTVLENSSSPSYSSMIVYLGGNTMMEVTKTLYLSEEGRFPKVLEYMKASQPWDMFNRDQWIREILHTSQAHVASWGNGAGDYIHCTGVIYTNSPFVLTIMMKNISDIDIMGGIAHHFCFLAQNMYWRQYEIEKAKKAAEAEALAAQEAAAAEEAPAEEAAVTDSTVTPASPENTAEAAVSPAPEPTQEEASSPTPRMLLMAAAALILVLLVVAAALLRNRRKQRPRRRARSGRSV